LDEKKKRLGKSQKAAFIQYSNHEIILWQFYQLLPNASVKFINENSSQKAAFIQSRNLVTTSGMAKTFHMAKKFLVPFLFKKLEYVP
jgi:hypothetical protein